MLDIEEANQVLNDADCLVSAERVQEAIQNIAKDIARDYADKNPLVLCVMKGAVFTASALLQHFRFPLEFDFLQVTRYRDQTTGGELEWRVSPSVSIRDRHVLVIDDIYDEGITLREIIKYCHEEGAGSVKVAVLTRKLHDRSINIPEIGYIALDVPDRYVFGCGMDYQGYFRNLNAIYAIKQDEQ